MNLVLNCVYRVCNSVKQQHREPISFRKLVANTRKTFNDHGVNLVIRSVVCRELTVNQFYVEAYYYEDQGHPPMEIIVYHRFRRCQKFETTQITNFLIQIYDAVVHEFRHQYQSQHRNYEHFSTNKSGYAAYLADPDELDAYALSIAIELLRHLPKFRAKIYMTRLQALSKMKRHSALISPILNSYVGQFKNNPLLKRLSKKVYLHMENIDSALIFK